MQAKKSDPFFPFHHVLENSQAKPASLPLSIPPLAPPPDFIASSFFLLEEELEYRSKLINDMSLITIGDVSLLALVSSNIVYLLESSKKEEGVKFRDSIIIDIKEKQSSSFPPNPILFPLPPETLLCCDFGFSSRFSGPATGQLDLTLACGGKSGVISLISIEEEYPVNYLIGHINEINVLRYAPPNPRFSFLNILASGSKDGGIIIWNVSHGTKVATLEPRANPHSDVVYLAWGMGGEFLVSIHLENNVKIWEITAGLMKKLELSHERISLQNDKGKKEEGCREIWEGKEAHKSFGMQIDQVECFGYGLVSKDVLGNVVVWMPSVEDQSTIVLKTILSKQVHAYYYAKFAISLEEGLLFLGNEKGEILIYTLEKLDSLMFSGSPNYMKKIILEDENCFIIKLAFSEERKILFALTERKHLYKIDINRLNLTR